MVGKWNAIGGALASWLAAGHADAAGQSFDLGGASAPGALRLSCLVRATDGAQYVANIAIDRKTKSVTAYFPALKSGLKFVDGRIGDPQYGVIHIPPAPIAQRVQISGETVSVVSETPDGASVVLYDLATNSIATASTIAPAASGAHECRRID